MATNCAFCRIVDGSDPAHEVWRDSRVVAFLDRSPVFKGHVLVVPATHFVTLADVPDEWSVPLWQVVRALSAAMPAALEADGTFVGVNNSVSQSVPHLHVHVVPRRRKDGLRGFFWPRVKYGADAEMAEIALRIGSSLSSQSS